MGNCFSSRDGGEELIKDRPKWQETIQKAADKTVEKIQKAADSAHDKIIATTEKVVGISANPEERLRGAIMIGNLFKKSEWKSDWREVIFFYCEL